MKGNLFGFKSSIRLQRRLHRLPKGGEKVIVEGNLPLLKYFKPQAGAEK